MGGITRGGTTRVGQAVTGSLTGAVFPECTAAIEAPLDLQLVSADEPKESVSLKHK